MTPTVLVSVTAFGSPPMPTEPPAGCVVRPRASDWGKRGLQAMLHHVAASVSLTREARKFDAVVICTSGIEVVILAALRRLRVLRVRVTAFDMLPPRSPRADRLVNWALGGLDAVGAIRSREVKTLTERFPSLAGRVSFVRFPAEDLSSIPTRDEGFVYAAGAAHRDWVTAFAAFAALGTPVTVASSGALPVASSNVTLLRDVSPERARMIAAEARAVVVPFIDTDLPHGPLVILDAMSLGKPVVATRTAGSVDYVSARTGILVPPGDARALAAALRRVVDDPREARAMGACGRARASNLTPDATLMALLGLVDDAAGRARR